MAHLNKRSTIWQYFDICHENNKFAVCLLCKCKISRGGEGKKAGTSAMNNHLKNKHPDKCTEAASSSASASCSTSSEVQFRKQLTLKEATERSLCWDMNDAKSLRYHYLIAEMIALDNEPLSVVERVGFTRLLQNALPRYKIPSRIYITEKIIPDIYDRIHMKIETNIAKADAISVTSDIWTCVYNNASFLSFTAHWLSPEFSLEHAVLAMKHFEGSHTGENIGKELHTIQNQWNIPQNKIHIIVHDSGPNIVKGVRLAEYNSARCFIHSLQRVVNESLKSQPEVTEMIVAARRIVTHFNHSGLAQEKLKLIQKELNLPEHQLVQDVGTRWNSTYYLLERLLIQKRAISLYITDNDSLNNLTPFQWDLMEQSIKLLKPFEEVTKITSSGLSCISEVIPHVATLLRYLEKEETARNTANLSTMRISLRTEIVNRINIDENYNYLLATLLDPRFKTTFMGIIQAERSRQRLLLEGLKMSCDDSSSSEEDTTPPTKIKRTGEKNSQKNIATKTETHNTFWDCYNEVANNNYQDEQSEKSTIAKELEYYLKTARIDRNEDSYAWWRSNTKLYPNLSKFAKIYLSSPSSSVYSERLFSEAGLVYENKRNRLLPTNSEKLVFIHHNLALVNFTY